jgi:Flp pilus assembly pilin Flp
MSATLRFRRLWREETGASSIEYALLASLIAVTCVAVLTALGTNALNLYLLVCSKVAAAAGNPPC